MFLFANLCQTFLLLNFSGLNSVVRPLIVGVRFLECPFLILRYHRKRSEKPSFPDDNIRRASLNFNELPANDIAKQMTYLCWKGVKKVPVGFPSFWTYLPSFYFC